MHNDGLMKIVCKTVGFESETEVSRARARARVREARNYQTNNSYAKY